MIANQYSLTSVLKEKRLDTGVKQGWIGEPFGMDQTTVSLYERETHRIKARGAEFAVQFISRYGFALDEARGLAKPLFDDLIEDLKSVLPPNDLPELPGVGKLVEIPILQAQGGTQEDHNAAGRGVRGGRTLQLAEVYLDGHKPENCRVVEVFGYSMACEDLRLSFQPGHRFIIDIVEEPQEGDILVADLFKYGEWHRIFKIFGREGRIVLRSYNDRYEPIVLEEGDELIKVGVYINRITEDRAEMRRLNRARMKKARE